MSIFDTFRRIGSSASQRDMTAQTGFNKQELQGFMRMAGSLNRATSRIDSEASGFGPQFSSKSVSKSSLNTANSKNASTDVAFEERKFNQGENLFTNEFSKEQVKGFIDAFKTRQTEVFGRRATPGISQTRLV